MKNNPREEIIDVKGMHCKSCVKLIEAKLARLKGIEKVRASIAEEKTFVQFDPNQISLDAIKEEIEDIGYGVDGKVSKSTGGRKGKGGGDKSGLVQGILYGLAAHTGCIAFIVATVLGTTVATEFFKPLMMNPYFFYILIAMSFVFATISSFLYLKKQGFITLVRQKNAFEFNFAKNILRRKWKYLSVMYGSTIAVNLLLFFVVFPALANVGPGFSMTGNVALAGVADGDFSLLSMKVAIPCPGHAPLISGELKKLVGVLGVKYKSPNIFDVAYDSDTVSQAEMLSLDVFEVYKPTVLDSVAQVDSAELDDGFNEPVSGGCGAGCAGGCGAGVGGCGCGAGT